MDAMRISLSLILFSACPLFSTTLPAQVTFVDASAIGSQDGSSWVNAYIDLQTALASSTQGEIWLAKGSYFPGLVGQRSATFQLKNKVAIYGGFSGNETARSQRDPQANLTVLSGTDRASCVTQFGKVSVNRKMGGLLKRSGCNIYDYEVSDSGAIS